MPESEVTNPSTMTTGEVYRLVRDLKADLKVMADKLDARPTKDDITHLESRIADLEGWQTWAMRLGIPALLGVVFNLLDTFNAGGVVK